jgi:hypothetical protein
MRHQPLARPRGAHKPTSKENPMTPSEMDIHAIVLRMVREGYAALNAAQRKIVDTLMAVC